MTSIFSNPQMLKTARYVGAYLLLVAAAALGLLIISWTRINILDFCLLMKVDQSVIFVLASPGTFFFFLPYVALVGLLEPYVHKAAKTGQVLKAARKLLMIEGSFGLVMFLVNLWFISMNLPQGF